MKPETTLKWLYLDLNSYFASVEQQANPRLRGRPVAVVPADTDYTCAIAASREAKAYGIKTGTIIKDAKKMCPGLICVPARHDLYVEIHNQVIAEVVRHTPINKICSIDELSSRLPPAKRNAEAACEIARRIRHGLRANIGECITASIGVAPNALLAKIASDMQKPNGLTLLHPETMHERLFALRLTDLPGIGPNMKNRLNAAKIQTVEQLWNLSPRHARQIWGSVQGERFWYALRGYDIESPEPQDSVIIGHSRVLDPQMRTPEPARLMARRLLAKAVTRLRRKEYHASVLSLGVRTTDGQRWRGETRLKTPAHEAFTFLEHFDGLWAGMLIDLTGGLSPARCGMRFKKVSVALTGLRRRHEITADLLDETREDTRRTMQKREALAAALDRLHEKYHKETVTLGTPPRTLSGYVGTKIAFSRVPDAEEFWE